jgi:hypothetical protein
MTQALYAHMNKKKRSAHENNELVQINVILRKKRNNAQVIF